MAASNDFLEYVLDQLSDLEDLYIKRMFGLQALYKDGLTFGLISKDIVYLKVDQSNKAKYEAAGSTPLKLFKNDSIVKSYYELPVEVLENAELFVEWVKESLTIQKNKRKSAKR